MQPYTDDFFTYLSEGARSSAKVVVPLVLELVQPKNVVDVGCGTGVWLSVFKEHGVEDIWGIDGEYVNKEMLEISEERFVSTDLKQPFYGERKFDLVVSLEVAEHLPSEYAETFVDSLTRLGPVVLFSAAIPHQGGIHHVNEQWPEYWAAIFRGKGYVAIDCLRRKIWGSEDVQPWYAQNIVVFAAQEHLEKLPALKREYRFDDASRLSIVHPRIYLGAVKAHRFAQNIKRIMPRKIQRIARAALVRANERIARM